MPGSSVPVRVPTLGESVVEATVGAWLKQEGQPVLAGETLVQLETEKVNVEVAAERSGVLGRIERQEGATVQPGEVLATLEDATVAAAPAQTQPDTEPLAAPSPNGGPTAAVDAAPATARAKAGTPEGEGEGEEYVDRPHASPVARRLAEEHGLDLGQVPGTGTGGRVTREDVERAIAQDTEALRSAPPAQPRPPSAPAVSPPPGLGGDGGGDRNRNSGREQRVRMSRRRQTIAQRLLEAQRTAAMLTTFNEVDMTRVMELRARRRDAFRERHGVGLGYMSFFTKAVIGALKAFPMVNAEISGDEIVLKAYYDIGIAVSAEGGLVVPVVRDADRKSFAAIEKEIAELAARAQANTLTLDDLRGGTFTITNGGIFGSLLSTPILSPPQVGILGMHRIQQRPVAVDGQVVVRPMMYLALSYDHRLVDGREAVQFLVRVKELVEDPETLLLEG